MTDTNAAAAQQAVANIADAVSKILGQCCGVRHDEEGETIEADNDVLIYRKTVVEVQVPLSGLTASVATVIDALAAAKQPKDPRVVEKLKETVETVKETAKLQETLQAQRRAKIIHDVFGYSVDERWVKTAVAALVMQLERVGPGGVKVLDKNGLEDAVARLVAGIPVHMQDDSKIMDLLTTFIPAEHVAQVVDAVLDALHDRKLRGEASKQSGKV